MFTYDCLIKFGHLGAGHATERNVRIRASNIIEAMRRARRMPGSKKGRTSPSVLRIQIVP